MAKKAEDKKVKATPKKEAKKTIKATKTTVKKTTVPVKKVTKKTATKKATVKETSVEKSKIKETFNAGSKAGYKADLTVEQLFDAGAHFGHVIKKWNPKMNKYLWGAKNGIHIFDLEKSLDKLNQACDAIEKASREGKRIVIVGTKRQARQMVEEMAKKTGTPYLTQRWLGGLITNWKQVKKTIDRLVKLKQQRETGALKKYTKKEQVLFDKDIARMERMVGGIADLKDVPEMVIVIDTHKEKLAVREAKLRGITVVGLVDSNANPDMIDYVVPMNDDSAKVLQVIIDEFGRAIMAGKKGAK